MADLLKALIHDTLTCLKDPLFPGQTQFATAEECSLFQRKPKEKQVTPISPPSQREITAPYPVRRPPPQTSFRHSAPLPSQEILQPAPSPKEPKSQTKTPETIIPGVIQELAPGARQSPGIEIGGRGDSIKLDRIKMTLQKIAPTLQLTGDIPDDIEAKKIAGAWAEKIPNTEVILLACQTDADTMEFFKNLARAIDQHLGRTKILPAEKFEQHKRWDLFLRKNSFRLIVASEGMQQLPCLMTFYRSVPPQVFLGKIPLLALSSSVLYKSIEHKAHLWKTLCQILGK